MAKHCWFCKNTEDFFISQKKALQINIEQELTECAKF